MPMQVSTSAATFRSRSPKKKNPFPQKTHARGRGRLPSRPILRSNAEAWEIVENNIRLLRWGIKKWELNKIYSGNPEEVESIAKLVFFHSAQIWNEQKEAFSTYAIADMRRAVRLVRKASKKLHIHRSMVLRILRYLEWVKKNPDGTPEQFGAHAKLSAHQLKNMADSLPVFLNSQNTIDGQGSFDGNFLDSEANGNGGLRSDTAIDFPKLPWQIYSNMHSSPESIAIHNNAKLRLAKIFDAKLPPREKEVLLMRMHGNGQDKGMTLKEIGEHLGLSLEGIRQVQKKAFARLRKFSSRELGEIFSALKENPHS